MVKLIRISTDNSNGHFKAQFDTDITIQPNSKIALKNLTFESSFGSFTANANNARVAFLGTGQVPNDFFEQYIEPGVYDISSSLNFFKEFEQALNRTINLQDGKSNTRSHVEIYGQFRVRLNNQNNIRIEFRQSSAININSLAYDEDDYDIDDPFPLGNTLCWTQPAAPHDQFDINTNKQELFLFASATPAADERYSFVPRFGLGLSKGAGTFYCRIKSSVVDGDATAPNGFSIGVSFGNPRMPDDVDTLQTGIAATERNCEITFIDKNSNYFFRRSHKGVASTNTDTGFAPIDVDSANIGQHDVLVFKIDNNPNNVKAISAHLYDHNGGAGRERLIFSQPLTDEEINGTLTPYIYMRGTKDNIQLDMLRFTPDPYFLVNDMNIPISTQPGKCDDVIGYVLQTSAHSFDNSGTITNPISEPIREAVAINYATTDANNLFGNTLGYFPKPSLFFGGDLAEVLGLNKTGDNSSWNLATRFPLFTYQINQNIDDEPLNTIGFHIDAPFETLFTKNDSYIVETLSLPLLSYNSSIRFTNNIANNKQINGNRQTRGSRRNILATIPFTDESGLVQYEPNEIVYIDISNNDKINLRNIELRILDANFDPIRIIGLADMTLLIDN